MGTTTNQFSNLTKVPLKTDATATKANKTKVDGTLSQTQFLKLMTTQMTHQDPSKPMQNGEFLTQMAQFGTVTGIQDLQKSFSDFATSVGSTQALQASSLVGHEVLANGSIGTLETGKKLQGKIELTDSTTNLSLQVANAKTGEIVRNLPLGTQAKGSVPFSWDGQDDKGNLVDPGKYKLYASAQLDGKATAMTTQVQSTVESVSMGSGVNGVKLNLVGGTSVDFNSVTQII